MLIAEIFTESSGFRLLTNPSISALLGLLNRSTHKSLRGLVVRDKVWWWDADMALHRDVARNLNHKDYIEDRLHLDLNDGEARFNTTDQWTFDRIMAHPVLSRIVKSPLIFSYESGYGWLPGPEWIAACQNLM
jgi:hypothetical protein